MFRCVIYTIFRENLVLPAQNHLLLHAALYVTLVLYDIALTHMQTDDLYRYSSNASCKN